MIKVEPVIITAEGGLLVRDTVSPNRWDLFFAASLSQICRRGVSLHFSTSDAFDDALLVPCPVHS